MKTPFTHACIGKRLTSLAALARRRGFTLLEVIIAVMVLALTSLGIFRFVQSNLRAVSYSVEDTEQQLSVERLVGLVQEEFFNLPARGQATLLGESLKLNGTDFDSIEWRSRGGPGLMTTAASGEYQVKLRIQQNLLSNAGALGKVTKVYSHAQSLAQCVQWLARHLPAVPRIAVASNAEAARLAAAEEGAAAIAGENAGVIYGLATLAPHIEDEPNNTTRFWVLGRQKIGASGSDATSLVMSCPNRPGAVVELLEPLARHGVSMSRFESRPARTGLWEYLFFVDVVGHRDDPAVAAALTELATRAPFLKLLGSYPAALD